MLNRARVYLELIKFGHTVFALPFAIIALLLAIHRIGTVRPLDVVGVIACMVFARTAAMGFNRWADRELDAKNPRTAGRAIPAGVLSPRQVLVFTLGSALLFIASTGIFYLSSQNFWPAVFSIPLLIFLFGYSYAKRFTAFAHLWLGCALAASPVAVWVALLPPGDWWPPFLLAAAIATWVAGFDIIYALQDIDVDRKLGLASIPARFGSSRALWTARGLHFATIVFLALLGAVAPELSWFYWVAFGVVFLLLALEHALANRQTVTAINLAFFQINAAIGIGLAVAVFLDLMFK